MPPIIVIGRGHSGTRAISHTLTCSGVYMGATLNISGDLVPPQDLYESCRVMAKHVVHHGGLTWDFSALHTMPIDPEFTRLLERYLVSVLSSPAERKGWKIPETTLILPWIVREFPEAHYIYWVRDPRDCILGGHVTDDLARFGVPYDRVPEVRAMRAVSWKYQREIMRSTPPPRRCIQVRFEDLVLDQERTLGRLEEFLGFGLARIPVRADSVGRWRKDDGVHHFPFFDEDLAALGYDPA
jgi:hypothetical protein